MIQGLIKEVRLLTTCPSQPSTLAASVGIKTWDRQQRMAVGKTGYGQNTGRKTRPPRGSGKAEALKKKWETETGCRLGEQSS